MSNRLAKLKVRNFRSLANVEIETNPINILFGPNGAGKSTLLDSIWFIRDCVKRGVDEAASDRSHGIGALWDKAAEGSNISIKVESGSAEYEVQLGFSSGRIEPFAGERLFSKLRKRNLIDRKIGSDQASFYHLNSQETVVFPLRDPEMLALNRYLDFEATSMEAEEIDKLLHFSNFYPAREADLFRLKKFGSESSSNTHLWERCQNLWSVLRNIHDRRGLDKRYDTIIEFMRESFPLFRDLLIEQTGPNSVYGNFIEQGRRTPIQASGVSDGHLQMLANLTALFATGMDRDSLIMFDEPEMSLHPYALSTFAKAVKLVASEWNKQIFIATHSPVLISQFEPKDISAVGIGEQGETTIQRVSEIPEIQDLLEEYATGSLYMAGVLAPQVKEAISG